MIMLWVITDNNENDDDCVKCRWQHREKQLGLQNIICRKEEKKDIHAQTKCLIKRQRDSDAHFKGRFYKLTQISQLFTCSCLQVPLCHNQKVKATDKKHSFINQIILYVHSLCHYDTNHNFEFAVQKSLTFNPQDLIVNSPLQLLYISL